MDPGITGPWGFDWAWGVPLIVLTVVFHAFGLGEIDKYAHLNERGVEAQQIFATGSREPFHGRRS
jgi:hypothetical protein